MRVSRTTTPFTLHELENIAAILHDIRKSSRSLLRALESRAVVRWFDPLCSSYKAMKYFSALRGALNEEWSGLTDAPSPFYGEHGKGCSCHVCTDLGQQP